MNGALQDNDKNIYSEHMDQKSHQHIILLGYVDKNADYHNNACASMIWANKCVAYMTLSMIIMKLHNDIGIMFTKGLHHQFV